MGRVGAMEIKWQSFSRKGRGLGWEREGFADVVRVVGGRGKLRG